MRYENIGELLKNSRETLGFSQTDLAAKLGYPHKHFIAGIERGARMIPYDRVKDFSKVLKIKISDIEDAFLEDCRNTFREKIN